VTSRSVEVSIYVELAVSPEGVRPYPVGVGQFFVRFDINRDPISYNGGYNVYSYCQNSPVVFDDPLGLAKGGKQSGKGDDPRYG
jgi:RHS repeat-associated protein